MKIKDRYKLKIEKMLFGGNSLARYEGFPVFIKSGCPEDIVEAEIVKVNKNYSIGKIISVVEKSSYRIEPKCPMHNVCGSCGWQYIKYEEQLKQKQNIVSETIKSITGHNYEVLPIIPSPKIFEYRCKVQLPVSQTKVSKRLLTGYYKENSHELVNIKYCMLHDEMTNNLINYIKDEAQKLEISGYDEQGHYGLLRHIIVRKSADNTNFIVILVINSKKITNNIKSLAEKIMIKYKNISGVCANLNTKKTNVILSDETRVIKGNDFYIENLGGIKYKISANSFFQVNPCCAEKIFNTVKNLINENTEKPKILDAYSGVSSFGIWLSSISSKVYCVEEVKSASADAQCNIKLNSVDNIKIINGDAEEVFNNLIQDNITFDVSVIDPPRKGCTEKSIESLVKLTSKYIIYVSCNISTLARDMNILEKYNFYPTYIQPADMFPNTYHIETIVMFEKNKKKKS